MWWMQIRAFTLKLDHKHGRDWMALCSTNFNSVPCIKLRMLSWTDETVFWICIFIRAMKADSDKNGLRQNTYINGCKTFNLFYYKKGTNYSRKQEMRIGSDFQNTLSYVKSERRNELSNSSRNNFLFVNKLPTNQNINFQKIKLIKQKSI